MTKYLPGHAAGHTPICPHCQYGDFNMLHLYDCQAYHEKISELFVVENQAVLAKMQEDSRLVRLFFDSNPNWFARIQNDLLDSILYYFGCLESIVPNYFVHEEIMVSFNWLVE